ncbi:hypothetical protein BDN72DRAFT_326010 [Pluteus cervinus]|uniref:Uncharacterized protein n=1 Tax=Pluteus cervinus TaxID=181527 RepID=A0ACD3B498_9AGAR|nr:hypothetical protein BDN72DRAFT_326010 [Pluteus cervinus]
MMHHIPQPPHSAGLGLRGPRPRVEPSQVPSPIDAKEIDRVEWERQPYLTSSGQKPPLCTTDYTALDQGNSSPKFVRLSTWALPSTSRLANDCRVPLAAVFQPFAPLDPREEEVPLVDSGDFGPPRCERCRAYINPWCTWVAGGDRWRCNLCAHETQVSPDYFCNLDANLHRLDQLQRPELNRGTVDFAVGEEYWASHPPATLTNPYYSIEPLPSGAKPPSPMNFVFAIDVSSDAVRCGALKAICSTLLAILYGGDTIDGDNIEPCFPPGSRLAVLTFDQTIHFYDLSSDSVPMLVVPDIEEVFVPLRDGLFVDPNQSRSAIEYLLESIPIRFENVVMRDSALGSAVRASLAALAGRGGHVVMFQSTMPTIGPGALVGQPKDADLVNTDKEKTLYKVRDIAWADIGEACAMEGVGVSMFLTPSQFIDVGSIGAVSTLTGGELFFHPRFDITRDAAVFVSQFRRLMSRTQVYNCTMRVRCSKGLRVSTYRGNFMQTAPTDIEIAVFDSDKSISVTLEHTGKLSPREFAYLQSAVLYTTADGQRRVRTCNVGVQIVELAGNIFQFADMDTIVCHFLRQALWNMPRRKMSDIRDDLTDDCSALLVGYRLQCASTTRSSQLIIPEMLRGLPAYCLGALKTKPLKARTVSPDVRNFYAHRLMSMNIRSLIHQVYPPVLALHDLSDDIALPDVNGNVQMPSLMRNSHLFMQSHGVYLIDNDELMVFWIGASASPQLLKDLFDQDDIMTLKTSMYRLPPLQTRLSTQVRNILANREISRGKLAKLYVARQNLDANELEFSDMLVEDLNNGTFSYVEYLTVLHNQIGTILVQGDPTTGLRSPW